LVWAPESMVRLQRFKNCSILLSDI
jgi:hypothetical protein